MLKNKNTEDYILLIFAILGIIIIVLTIFNFAFHSHVSFFGNIDNDKLSAFSGFIGGIVGTIFSATATILVWMALKTQQKDLAETKKLTQQQIDLSIKPEVFVMDSEFTSTQTLSEDDRLVVTSRNTQLNNHHTQLINIGFGSAKSIIYRWDCDIIACFDAAKKGIKAYGMPPDIKFDFFNEVDGWMYTKKMGQHKISALIAEEYEETKFDVLVSYSNQGYGKKISVPHSYLNYLIISSNHHPTTDVFPPLMLKVKYMDVANVQHSKVFEINFKYRRDFSGNHKTELDQLRAGMDFITSMHVNEISSDNYD